MAPGGKSARVYVAVSGDENEQKQCVAALNDAVGYIRHQLADALSLRVAPEFRFVLDSSNEYGSRIDELLHRIEKRSKKRQP
jgi:ribosome-binding factor A